MESDPLLPSSAASNSQNADDEETVAAADTNAPPSSPIRMQRQDSRGRGFTIEERVRIAAVRFGAANQQQQTSHFEPEQLLADVTHINREKIDLWERQFFHSKTAIISLMYAAILLMMLWYKYYSFMTWADAFYLAVSNFWRIGYTAPAQDRNDLSRIVTILFIYIGVFLQSLLYSIMYLSSCTKTDDRRHSRLWLTSAGLLVVLFVGVMWAYTVLLEWSFLECVYFSLSTISTWGIIAINTYSAQSTIVFVSVFALLGCTLFFLFAIYLSVEIEVAIQKHILYVVSKAPITAEELQQLTALFRSSNNNNNNNNSSNNNNSNSGGDEEMQQPVSDNNNSSEVQLSIEEAKFILLRRVQQRDVGSFYSSVRLLIPLAMLLLIALALLYYSLRIYYSHSSSYSNSSSSSRSTAEALNYALSDFYKLGYSAASTSSSAVIVFSSLLFTAGFLCLLTLNVSISRELAFIPRQRRNQLSWVFSISMVLLLLAAMLSLFLCYGLDSWGQSLLLAVDIMTGVGGIEPLSETAASLWSIDVYTLVAVPLFAVFAAHLIAQLDVTGQQALLEKVIRARSDFGERELTLLEALDAALEQELITSTSATAADGDGSQEQETVDTNLREFYILLIVRLRDRTAAPLLESLVQRSNNNNSSSGSSNNNNSNNNNSGSVVAAADSDNTQKKGADSFWGYWDSDESQTSYAVLLVICSLFELLHPYHYAASQLDNSY